MSKIALDLKDFKHVKSDKYTTTLRHKLGHELTISHKTLKPESKAQLEALAEGGKAEKPLLPESAGRDNAVAFGKGETSSASQQMSSGLDNAKKELSALNPFKAEGGGVESESALHQAVREFPGDVSDAVSHAGDTAQTIYSAAKNGLSGDLKSDHKEPVKMAQGGTPYEQGLPCLNPHCKSHGRPHPNCRCYSGMAEGGKAVRYCAHGMPHKADCEYAEGGDVKVDVSSPNVAPGANMPTVQSDSDSGGGGGGGLAKLAMSALAAAKGGKVSGTSEQGRDVRHAHTQHDKQEKDMAMDFAKDEAKGRATMERTVKPNLKGLAEGGGPEDAKEMPQDKKLSAFEQQYPKLANTIENFFKGPIPGAANTLSNIENAHPDTGQMTQLKAPAPGPMSMPQAQSETPQEQPQPQAQEQAPAPAPQQQPPAPGYNVKPVVDNSATPMEMFDAHKQDIENKLQTAQPDDPQTSVLQHLNAENQAYAHDMANGHITAKTYESMFNDKNTLGKVGTLFGLMLSGAGSGLSGQPNAMLHMMDNEIQTDLQAQMKSKDNAQNFLRMNQQALMNKANVRALDTENQVKAFALAQGQMLQSTYNQLAMNTMKMPEGPAKQQAMQQLAMVHTAVGDKINNVNALAASSAAYYKTMFPDNAGVNNEDAFQKGVNARLMMGQKGEALANNAVSKHIPGIMGMASKPLTEGDRARVDAHNVLDNKINDVLSFARKHSGLKDQVDPSVIKEGAQKAHELAAFYNKTVDNLGMTSGRLDWLDAQIKKNPQSIIQQLLGNNAVLNEIKNSNATRKDLFLTKTLGFPAQSKAKNQGPADNTPQQGKDGRMYIRQGNYMVPVK